MCNTAGGGGSLPIAPYWFQVLFWVLLETLSGFVLTLTFILISATQSNPALLPSFYTGPNQR